MLSAKKVAMVGWIVVVTTWLPNFISAKSNEKNRINDKTESIRWEVVKLFLVDENKDTIDFKQEYIYQKLDVQLYDFLSKKGMNKLVKYYGEEWFKDKVEILKKTIIEHPDLYCNIDKNKKLLGLNSDSKSLNDLYNTTFSEYFQYIETKIKSEVRKVVKEKRLKKLVNTFGQKWTEEFLFEITMEIAQNPEGYGEFDNEWKYSLFDENWNLFKKKEVQKLRKEHTDFAKLLQTAYGTFLMGTAVIITRIWNTD